MGSHPWSDGSRAASDIRLVCHLHQTIRAVTRRTQQPAPSVIFERTAEGRHTRRCQRRGNRIPFISAVFVAVESESHNLLAIEDLRWAGWQTPVRYCR